VVQRGPSTNFSDRKIGAWTALHHTVEVPFEDPLAFRNLNTLEDCQQLENLLRP